MIPPAEVAELWERVRNLKPRLRPHAQIYHHIYRGEPWHIIRDRASSRHFRLSAGAYEFVASMDGVRTLDELWNTMRERLGEDQTPGHEELLQLVGRLREADLLRVGRRANAGELFSRWQRQHQRQRWGVLLRPLLLRFPLLDPESLLNTLLPLARVVFGPVGMAVWFVTIAISLLLTATHWTELTVHGATRMLDPANLVLLALAYPVIKALHELGHGLAIKVRGGEVHEMGIMLIVLMPVPYVDASAANAFVSKAQRMAVGAAGVLVETFLAASGLLVWLLVEPGLARDLAFNVAVIGGVSTLLFNGNPLLRFDGYYVLADAIEIPNLGSRSNQYYAYLVKRYLLGLEQSQSPVTAPGERPWFLAYGAASYAYGLVIGFAIALYVADEFLEVGIVLAVWTLTARFVYPLGSRVAWLLFDPVVTGRRLRGLVLVSFLVLITGLSLHYVQVPSSTLAEGFIRLPEQTQVRAGGAGFIRGPFYPSGQRVAAGVPLFELNDPALDVRIKVLELRMVELETDRTRSLLSDRVRAAILKEKLAVLAGELTDMRAQSERQIIRSPVAGILTVPSARDLAGRFARQGDLLGYVIDRPAEVVKVVVPQASADLIRRRTLRVEARFTVNPTASYTGRVLRETPLASGQLPSRSLGSQGGGAIAVDASDTEGLTAIEPVFEFDVLLPGLPAEFSFVGSRVLVKFVHDAEPLTRQWGRRLQQLLLSRLQI